MKTNISYLKLLLIGASLLITSDLISQSSFATGYGWVVPRVSQQAKVYQKVGVTEIEVEYSRPYVKDRQVWEEPRIAPYDKVWRAGANEATTISFSTDVKIGGKDLKAGKYAFFLIPSQNKPWVAIFNTVHSQWGAFTYNESKDAVRVEVSAQTSELREAVEFGFPELTAESTVMSVRWEKIKVEIPISVDVAKTSAAVANTTFDWQAGFFAAEHFINLGSNLDEALKWAKASIAMNENYSNLNQKLTILEKQENIEEAKKTAAYILSLTEGKADNASKYYKKAMEEKIKDLGG